MQRRNLIFFSLIFVAIFLISAAVGAALDDETSPTAADNRPMKVDDRMDPLTAEQRSLHAKALEAKLYGKTQGKTHKVGKGIYVELEREGEDPVWTVLGDFADYPHNSIPEPDRNFDNTTIWEPDFNREYFLQMLFDESEGANSMRQYYIENSANRYAVYGDVTDWVNLPGEACDYDDGDPGPGDAQAVWQFLIDAVDGWYANQLAAGQTPAEINDYLSQFDIWDRYDWDEDGNFDEPDGYIDHMQFVHAGEGNEAGGGELGDCSIWSHSWYTYYNLIGVDGPSPDFLIGGIQIGDSDFWVGKYTIQPENGGVGVFAHEFGHDLGLPDLYDYTGENATGFWTIMSSGSWLSQSSTDIGSEPNHFGAWEKYQLGWLKHDVVYAGEESTHILGPAEANTKYLQGLFVVLPEKDVTEVIGDPYAGDYFYYSGAGNDIDHWMTRAFTLGTGSSLTAMVNVQIEVDWDYAYLVVSTDGGTTWESVNTNLSTDTDPNSQNFGFGITGDSGGWVELTADLSAYSGDVLLGFRYWTDGAVVEPGLMVDDIAITGLDVDGGESDTGWDYDGFIRTMGIESASYFNAYVAEFRQYWGYDAGLANAYNFSFPYSSGLYYNWVDHFPYQDGLLISYWDASFPNNDVTARCDAGLRCGGLLLPVDAHSDLLYIAGKQPWRNRIQTFDATFGLERTDQVTLHWNGKTVNLPSLPAVPVFDDLNSYWNEENPTGSVQVPPTGTQIRVNKVFNQGLLMEVEVGLSE